MHQVKHDWYNTIHPCVPGHKIISRIVLAGSAVTKFKTGDMMGVGCIVNACGTCSSYREGEENYYEGPVGWVTWSCRLRGPCAPPSRP